MSRKLVLQNQYGETSINYENVGIDPNGVIIPGTPVVVQRLQVTFAMLNAIGSGVALNMGGMLPIASIIKNVYYNVLTTFLDNGTSSNLDSSTLSIGANTAVDLKAAIAISNGANPWDAGIGAGIPVGTAATFVKTTAARNLNVTWTHGSGDSTALVAGEMYLFVEYVQGR